jgi:hypothetical protein
MKRVTWMMAVVLTGSGLAGCMKVMKDPNDKTPPSVEIKVKGADGQYAVASSATISASAASDLDWMCIASDANGVMSAQVNYTSTLNGCTIESTVWDCAASYQAQPQNQFQKTDGDASGQVPTQLPLLLSVHGGFTCTCPGIKGVGIPYGRTIKATCAAANWSSDPAKQAASKVLTINLQ